jgi:hypothetical protein
MTYVGNVILKHFYDSSQDVIVDPKKVIVNPKKVIVRA